MKHPAVNLAGKLSLDELTYLISRFNLLITNDSGPMHIAQRQKHRSSQFSVPKIRSSWVLMQSRTFIGLCIKISSAALLQDEM